MSYKNLKTSELETIASQGCRAENWQNVFIKDTTDLSLIQNVYFGGTVKIGELTKIQERGAVQQGLYNSEIYDCVLGDGVRVSNVAMLRLYEIGDRAVVQNVGYLSVDGETSFGNGAEVEALNEGGGRTITIYDRLSAQIAYLVAVYRHRPQLIERINQFINDYVKTRTATVGSIGEGAKIANCQTIKNVSVGPHATIDGAMRLENGTIASNKDAPVKIGSGVFAKEFIVQSGSSVDSGAVLEHTFVGQAVKIGKQFSAENSVFFANCEGFHGEACSIFAGPYTVTHHKSTLLIAGLFSFYNAGSGTNQSNHMYKLGPNHQGILQRGSKTGSFSYMLWPCAVGPFSVVIGKHYSNFDTTDLPFSYINEDKGKSLLTPAMNLFTVGTRRDSQKWPSRDRRKDAEKFDLIHFDLLSPFVMEKVYNGSKILQDLYDKTAKEIDFVQYKGVTIKRLMLKTCRKYYDMALKIFLGESLIERLNRISEDASLKALIGAENPSDSISFEWVDLCGLLGPASCVESFTQIIENGEIDSLDGATNCLRTLFDAYDDNKWVWSLQLMERMFEGGPSKERFQQIVEDWKKNRVKLINMIVQDASKEFDQNATIGYGVDGDEAVRQSDFEQVRGSKESNSFICDLHKEITEVEERAAQALKWIEKMG